LRPRGRTMDEAVAFRGVSKYFPSSNVQADADVSFGVRRGEIHAVCGENGAGKSTLMNMLYGLYHPDSGQILVDGVPVRFTGPLDAIGRGIGMVHQHFKLVPSFTVTENIFLGMEAGRLGILKKTHERDAVRSLAERYRLPIDPDAPVSSLPVGLQQRVEILKLLIRDVSILIFDEPTAVLTPAETRELLAVLKGLAAAGKTILFISHKLREVLEIADRVTVMRKGAVVGTREGAQTSVEELARMMVGRDVTFRHEKEVLEPGAPILEVQDLRVGSPLGVDVVKNLSFTIRGGEIYGIAGVSGNGQEALVAAIAGLTRIKSGSIRLLGTEIGHLDAGRRRELGLAHVPEDRIGVGLNILADVRDNVAMGRHRKAPVAKAGILDQAGMSSFAAGLLSEYSVAGASVRGPVAGLSGGNMQKIVLGREFSSEPRLLIVNQPTRGLDIGSIEFVHAALLKRRAEGAAVLLLSVELDEILALSDRVGVLYRGEIAGEFEGGNVDEERIGLLMAGGAH